jgi:hypothetical protein
MGDDSSAEMTITWNDALETLVAEEAEKCGGLAWLHAEAERYYSHKTNWVAIPVIILSTVNGFLSGSSSTLFASNQVASSIGVGMISLFTGIVSTIGSYFAWAKRTEAHRISAIQYQKMSKFLAIELTLPKVERIAAKDILKITKDQIERLLEISPAIPLQIVAQYKKTFNVADGPAQPEIIGGFKKIVINKWVAPEIGEQGEEKVRISFNQYAPISMIAPSSSGKAIVPKPPARLLQLQKRPVPAAAAAQAQAQEKKPQEPVLV